jgi:predicted RNA-binding Zn-ribbon protein involved in translation (DUF1610 family)
MVSSRSLSRSSENQSSLNRSLDLTICTSIAIAWVNSRTGCHGKLFSHDYDFNLICSSYIRNSPYRKIAKMQTITKIICPNCGSPSAERHQLSAQQLTRTQCHDCDYLLVTCQRTNRVIEAYAPGIDIRKSRQAILVRNL